MRTIARVAACLVLCAIARAEDNYDKFQEFQLGFVLQGACAGQEDIAITGTERMFYRQNIDGNGVMHCTYRFVFQGDAVGVGLSSGIRYQLVGSGGGSEIYTDGLPLSITRHVRFSFVGPGPANNVQAFESANIKCQEDGTVQVWVTNAFFKCPD
jgi:hypothetical protein